MPKKDRAVDWLAVEKVMRKSITGGTLSEQDSNLCTKAHTLDGRRYAELHAMVREQEQSRVNPLARTGEP